MESKLAEQAIDDEYNTFLQNLDNIKAKQDNNNNSDTDNNKINTIKTIIDNKIENNKNISLVESGNRVIFNNPKEKEKYITIVAKLVN
jgi:precorrin-4 methylase